MKNDIIVLGILADADNLFRRGDSRTRNFISPFRIRRTALSMGIDILPQQVDEAIARLKSRGAVEVDREHDMVALSCRVR